MEQNSAKQNKATLNTNELRVIDERIKILKTQTPATSGVFNPKANTTVVEVVLATAAATYAAYRLYKSGRAVFDRSFELENVLKKAGLEPTASLEELVAARNKLGGGKL